MLPGAFALLFIYLFCIRASWPPFLLYAGGESSVDEKEPNPSMNTLIKKACSVSVIAP